jgi:hypothetical protein
MRATFATLAALPLTAVALMLVFPGLRAGSPGDDPRPTPPGKDQPPTVEDLREKLKAGTFKLTEAEVVRLLGRPAGVKRPGDAGSDLRMHWEYATHISATFRDGKLGEVSGSFSENLPVERVSMANFKRLRVGMTEQEVVGVLGEANSVAKVGTTTTRSWGRTARLWVSFNAKGLAFGEGLHESSAVSVPPEIQLPTTVPLPIKP